MCLDTRERNRPGMPSSVQASSKIRISFGHPPMGYAGSNGGWEGVSGASGIPTGVTRWRDVEMPIVTWWLSSDSLQVLRWHILPTLHRPLCFLPRCPSHAYHTYFFTACVDRRYLFPTEPVIRIPDIARWRPPGTFVCPPRSRVGQGRRRSSDGSLE